MLTQAGIVVALKDAGWEQLKYKATIKVLPPSACELCSKGQGCGAGLFARLLRMRPTELILPVTNELKVGQRVWLAMDERQAAKQAWFWYGLPILGFVLGASLPLWLPSMVSGSNFAMAQPGQDALSLLSGTLLLITCWAGTRLLQRPQLPRVLLNSPCRD